jgi:hypothetical protein
VTSDAQTGAWGRQEPSSTERTRPSYVGLAVLGGVLALLAAAGGSFGLVLGYNAESQDLILPAMPWHLVQFFPLCFAGAALALAAGPVMRSRPRAGAYLGLAGVFLGVVSSLVAIAPTFVPIWLAMTSPLTIAATLALPHSGRTALLRWLSALPLVYGIYGAVAGSVDVLSTAGQGATFYLSNAGFALTLAIVYAIAAVLLLRHRPQRTAWFIVLAFGVVLGAANVVDVLDHSDWGTFVVFSIYLTIVAVVQVARLTGTRGLVSAEPRGSGGQW